MQLLTPERFRERQAELVDLRQKADADYRRANLDSAMGSGTEADVLKAKQALDLLVGQLEGLEAARVESNRIQAAETQRAREAAHKKLVEDTERLLMEREATVARIEAMALKLHEEMGKFDKLTSDLRAAAMAYQPHFFSRGADHVMKDRMARLVHAAAWNHSLPLMVSNTVKGDKLAMDGATVTSLEKASARMAREQIEQVAPEREMA